MNKEYQKLITENRELKAEIDRIHKVLDGWREEGKYAKTKAQEIAVNSQTLENKLNSENQRLLTENKELKEISKTLKAENDSLLAEIDGVKKDNERLRIDKNFLGYTHKNLREFRDSLEITVDDDLKAENDRLVAEVNKLHTKIEIGQEGMERLWDLIKTFVGFLEKVKSKGTK